MNLAKVNNNAYDTWLEPYIGYEFEYTKITKSKIYFKVDMGFGKFIIESTDLENFDILNN